MTLSPGTPVRLLRSNSTGPCQQAVPLLHQRSPCFMVRAWVGSTAKQFHGKHLLFETTVIIREQGEPLGCYWVIAGSLKKSSHAQEMSFAPANLRVVFSCLRNWESDMVHTTLFFLGGINNSGQSRQSFLKDSMPSKGFFCIGSNTGQCTKTDFNKRCKCISVDFFSCVVWELFENIYTM